jgi:hypothetical protein
MEAIFTSGKIDNKIKKWYETTDKSNSIAAISIGYYIVVSNNYTVDKDNVVASLNDQLEDKQNRINKLIEDNSISLSREKDKFKELENKFNIDNRQSIDVAVDKSLESVKNQIKTLEDFNRYLEKVNEENKLKLDKTTTELTEMKCSYNISKNKGEITEKKIHKLIESEGYKTKKAGNHSGDILVYSRDSHDNLICILEIKNYGDDNKSKLGPNGSETKKMYKDIETQLKSCDFINVPWIFISLGCEIPKIEELRERHCGIRCEYLSQPSDIEILVYIKYCEMVCKLNNNKEGKNIIYIQQKISEIYDIFNKIKELKPDFKSIKELLLKLKNKLEKEEVKYTKLLDDNNRRIDEIIKDIHSPHEDDSSIDCSVNIDELPYDKLKIYVGKLQRACIKTSKIEECGVDEVEKEMGSNKKCEYCGVTVKYLKSHYKSNKCKKYQSQH